MMSYPGVISKLSAPEQSHYRKRARSDPLYLRSSQRGPSQSHCSHSLKLDEGVRLAFEAIWVQGWKAHLRGSKKITDFLYLSPRKRSRRAR
jgi:hypothetical protein